ncbi:uncharacterized protein G2W53_012277 [Senna tora]|uniref:Uncharacterized protein n=1 Tax=Senna tora TaxID=362788 RepID=A0A834TXU0_9FABA|nr:uncharacterized protein G2W53_012277 [Senna tora]
MESEIREEVENDGKAQLKGKRPKSTLLLTLIAHACFSLIAQHPFAGF